MHTGCEIEADTLPWADMKNIFKVITSVIFISLSNMVYAETDLSMCDSIAKAEGRQLCYERLGAAKLKSNAVLDISSLLKEFRFEDAIKLLSKVKTEITTAEQDKLEKIALEVIKPIPSSKRSLNSSGYLFLNYLRPDNGSYALKIIQYGGNANVAAKLKSLKYKVDKFTKITTYYHTDIPLSVSSGSRIRLTINMDTSGNTYLSLATIYNSDMWLWVKRVDANIDGINSALTYGNFNRDNSVDIWEWREETPSSTQLQILRKIAAAKSVTLRYYGEEFYSDRKLSQRDIKAIADLLIIFDQINELQLNALLADKPDDFIPQKIIRSVGREPMRCYDPIRKSVYSHGPYGMSCSSKDYPISDQDFNIFNKLKSNR